MRRPKARKPREPLRKTPGVSVDRYFKGHMARLFAEPSGHPEVQGHIDYRATANAALEGGYSAATSRTSAGLGGGPATLARVAERLRKRGIHREPKMGRRHRDGFRPGRRRHVDALPLRPEGAPTPCDQSVTGGRRHPWVRVRRTTAQSNHSSRTATRCRSQVPGRGVARRVFMLRRARGVSFLLLSSS